MDVSEAVAEQVPLYEVVERYDGPATIAAVTVQFSGDDPVNAIFVCDLPEARRTLATSNDPALIDRAMREELCGRQAVLTQNQLVLS